MRNETISLLKAHCRPISYAYALMLICSVVLFIIDAYCQFAILFLILLLFYYYYYFYVAP